MIKPAVKGGLFEWEKFFFVTSLKIGDCWLARLNEVSGIWASILRLRGSCLVPTLTRTFVSCSCSAFPTFLVNPGPVFWRIFSLCGFSSFCGVLGSPTFLLPSVFTTAGLFFSWMKVDGWLVSRNWDEAYAESMDEGAESMDGGEESKVPWCWKLTRLPWKTWIIILKINLCLKKK